MSKPQNFQRSHVGFEFTQTGEDHSRALNGMVIKAKSKNTSLGPNVATDKGRIFTTAYTNATAELPNYEDFKVYVIVTYTKMENLQKQ